MDPIRDVEQWRAAYRDTAEVLERIRARALHAMTEQEALRIIESLCVAEPPWRERPDWSGLVEQQALFQRQKLREKSVVSTSRDHKGAANPLPIEQEPLPHTPGSRGSSEGASHPSSQVKP